VERTVRALDRAASIHPVPAAIQARAVAQVLLHRRRRDLDQAIADLERTAPEVPSQAAIWSDLAAAYLVRAQQDDDPLDLTRALLAADHATAAPAPPAEALFNRALALESLGLVADAKSAWSAYLAADGVSAWAAEAREHLRKLAQEDREPWPRQRLLLERAVAHGDLQGTAAIVRRSSEAVREHGELELLGAWADSAAVGEAPEAARLLATARRIGDAVAQVQADRMLADAVAAVDRAAAGADRRRWQALVEGHRALRDGHRLYKAQRSAEAARQLRAARQALARGGSPLAARATFFLACCDYQLGRNAQARAAIERLAGETADRPYPTLTAHLAWMQALLCTVQGELMPALDSYGRALALYERLGEPENVASVHALLAEALRRLGQRQASWEHCYRALRVVSRRQDPRFAYRILVPAADTALQNGQPEIALYLQGEVVRQAARIDPSLLADALFWHALIEHRLGHGQQALGDLRLAKEQIARLAAGPGRRRAQADLSFIEGTIAADGGDLHRAAALLTAALQVYQQQGNAFFAVVALRARARVARLAGDDRQLEEDLRAALAIYERLGWGLEQEDMRLAFIDETEDLFDAMILLHAQRGKTELALADADRARTRVLGLRAAKVSGGVPDRRRLLAVEPDPLALTVIRRHLSPLATVVVYSVQEDQVLIWTVRRDGVRSYARPVRLRDLKAMVAGLRTMAPGRQGLARWSRHATALFDLLVRCWLPAASEGDSLVFVPDKALGAVPFASLVDRVTGEYLVERHRIATAPSATLYVQSLLRTPRSAAAPPAASLLVVGDPAIDVRQFPQLPALPGAAAEARGIAALDPSSTLLLGRGADKPSFLARAAGARQIHFAGHALVNARNPLLSMLVLAPSAGDSGALYAWELYERDLARTELVVLAACDTDGAEVSGGEGVASLARGFLAAGVRTVVASLWAVDDHTTAMLFSDFYRRLFAGSDPASALRGAQLSLLHADDEAARSPAAWGAFEVIGASAP
jgi:CHAT domain-containing protein/tetratricopeptide (TPR) repeat protein